MPEYLAPGVFVEETSFRPKTIEGVSTSTAAFVGPTRFGPTAGEPEILTSFAEFERIYGGLDPLVFEDGSTLTNYVAHAARAFFDEGGKRLYVSRAYDPGTGSGRAQITLSVGSVGPDEVVFRARHPGYAGNVTARLTFRLSGNVLVTQNGTPDLLGVTEGDVVWTEDTSSTPVGALYWVDRLFDDVESRFRYQLRQDDPTADPPVIADLSTFATVRVVTVNVTVSPLGRLGDETSWEGLGFHPGHKSALSRIFDEREVGATDPPARRAVLYAPLMFAPIDLNQGAEIAAVLLAQSTPAGVTVLETLSDSDAGDAERTYFVRLTGGTDGDRPGPTAHEGDDSGNLKSGLKALEDVEDVSIVAAPGATQGHSNGFQTDSDAIVRHVISHCERMRYRIGVLDSVPGHLVSEVREYRGQVDSKHAALYYPWIRIFDPISEDEILIPPSGSVAGIYARNDTENGAHKAPANEVVRQALGFELLVNKGQQEILNPAGVNCFRFFEGRGNRLWGARTISSDPEWKYVNLRRYFAFLERSIEKGTQWAVFENNDDRLWSNIRRTVESFLFNEFNSGHLYGTRPDEAYFVRCDRSTMTQNDIDNGRLVCLIGVSPVRPAEFVIFRIGQWTASRNA